MYEAKVTYDITTNFRDGNHGNQILLEILITHLSNSFLF